MATAPAAVAATCLSGDWRRLLWQIAAANAAMLLAIDWLNRPIEWWLGDSRAQRTTNSAFATGAPWVSASDSGRPEGP